MMENGVPMFEKIRNNGTTQWKIKTDTSHYIIGDATHIGIYAGKIAFFKCTSWPISYSRGRKWRFFKIPEVPDLKRRADYVAFPEYKYTKGGHCYGMIEFF